MTPNEPPPPPPGADADAQLLDELRDRIRQTQEAAERIAREAAESARHAGGLPPLQGYSAPGAGDRLGDGAVQGLVALLEAVRALVPPELADEIAALVRELLLLLRTLIDWYLQRTEARRAQPVEVEDIPIG